MDNMNLLGIDSDVVSACSADKEYEDYGKPQVLGFWPSMWTKQQVQNTGIKYGYALSLPPQTYPFNISAWIADEIAFLKSYLPTDSPVFLDIEKQTTEEQFGNNIGMLIGQWQNACRQNRLKDGVYGSTVIQARVNNTSWFILAEWPKFLPDLQGPLPSNYGWQVAGDYGSGQEVVDLNIISDKGPFINIAKWKAGKSMYGIIDLSENKAKPPSMADMYYLFASGKCMPVRTPSDEKAALDSADWHSTEFSVAQVVAFLGDKE